MSNNWVSLADLVVGAAPMSETELSEFGRLATAIRHAITVAGEMPTTFDPRARALVVTKLQEAEHWSIELLRITKSPPVRS